MYFKKVSESVWKNKVKFELKESVKPVFKSYRKVPFAALEPVNEELKRLEKLGVISKIYYSDWASPTVFVKNFFKIRVCEDTSTGVNNDFKDHSYLLLPPEDIFAQNILKNWFIRGLSLNGSWWRVFKRPNYNYTKGFVHAK